MTTTELRHNRVRLALHELRSGAGRPLLLLHGLGERTPDEVPSTLADWPGPIAGVDFTGHGGSTVPRGGGYTAELLMGDADAALAHLGPSTVVGRGLGAYIALLLAGGRPQLVRGAVLCDGPGLAGGGPVPGSPFVYREGRPGPPVPDHFALAELTSDVRPPDYATSFARQAVQLSGLAEPITVDAHGRPQWLQAVADEPGVVVARLASALQAYASID